MSPMGPLRKEHQVKKSSLSKKLLVGAVSLAAVSAMAFGLFGCGGGGGDAEPAADSGDAGQEQPAAAGGDALRFVTGGESGTYYAFGSVIANHATNEAGVAVTALSSDGSKANVQTIQDQQAELGFCQADVMAYAYEGTNVFKDEGKVENFSTVAALYDEQIQIVTLDDSIQSVTDLKGKNVSIGAAGSGVYFNAIDILGVYGLTEQDINPTYQSFGDSANDLKDGKIDAAFIVAGAPTTAITDLSTTKQPHLISLDADHVSKLLESGPFYVKATIPAGTYQGQDADIETVAVSSVIIARDDVPEDAIYAFVADIFDNAANLTDTHDKYNEVDLEKGASITTVPYHPGAAKYFKEKGFEVATK